MTRNVTGEGCKPEAKYARATHDGVFLCLWSQGPAEGLNRGAAGELGQDIGD